MFPVLVEAEKSLEGELGREVSDGHRTGRVLTGRSGAQLLVVSLGERVEGSPANPLRPDPLPTVEVERDEAKVIGRRVGLDLWLQYSMF